MTSRSEQVENLVLHRTEFKHFEQISTQSTDGEMEDKVWLKPPNVYQSQEGKLMDIYSQNNISIEWLIIF